MGSDSPWEALALYKNILNSKSLAWARLILRGGCLAWALAVIWNLTRSPLCAEQTLGIMILGGGSLFLMGRVLKGWEEAFRRQCRNLSKEIIRGKKTPCSRLGAQLLVSCLLESDLKRLSRSDFRKRTRRFLESFVPALGKSHMERLLWLQAVSAPLWTLKLARSYWGSKGAARDLQGTETALFMEFKEEEILELLLASILVISALFRLQLRIWGMPQQGLARANISFLRRRWLPFCAMEPFEAVFPPVFPKELSQALREDPVLARGKELCKAWVFWLGKAQGLNELIQRIGSG